MLICSVKYAHRSFTSGSALTVGYNYGLPLSHLLLARQLEGLTTLRKRSVLYDDRLKKTRLAIDWSMAVALPVIGILLHLTQQVRCA
jgi:pheromone a factor receptor